ncbi:hypothetical protein CENTIMANUS_00269 [Klebsiella phage vB_KpM_Centimanus]
MEAKKFNDIWVPVYGYNPLPLLNFLKAYPDFSDQSLEAHPAILIDGLVFAVHAENRYLPIPVNIPFAMTKEDNFSVLVPHTGVVERQEGKILLGGEYRITDPGNPTLSVVAIMLDNEENVKPYPLVGMTLSGFVYTK